MGVTVEVVKLLIDEEMDMKILIGMVVGTLSLACVVATPVSAKERLLSQDELKELLTDNWGRHWLLDHERWYVFYWHGDGTLTVDLPYAKPGDEPVQEGTWRVKEILAEEGDDPKEIEKKNAELSYLYCQKFDEWGSNNELCFEMVQESFDKVAGTDELARTQEYKCYREAGAETGAFTITQKQPSLL
jgi:hypothetical protein